VFPRTGARPLPSSLALHFPLVWAIFRRAAFSLALAFFSELDSFISAFFSLLHLTHRTIGTPADWLPSPTSWSICRPGLTMVYMQQFKNSRHCLSYNYFRQCIFCIGEVLVAGAGPDGWGFPPQTPTAGAEP
jgi:hypothetical protein